LLLSGTDTNGIIACGLGERKKAINSKSYE